MKYSKTIIPAICMAMLGGACASPVGGGGGTPVPLASQPSPIPAVSTAALGVSTASVTPEPRLTPTELSCLQQGGMLQDGVLASKIMPQPLEFRIYLPPCYDQLPEHSYPTIYLIHGQTYSQDQWDRLGADEQADEMILIGESVPFIIVMPRDRTWDPPEKDLFGEAVVNELIPYIDENYRTIPDREHRAVGGLSRGASWAVHLGLNRWDLFGTIGAHSLPVFWSDVTDVRPLLQAIPPESMPRIYIDIATKDSAQSKFSSEWFVRVLIEEGIPHEWYLFVGEHNEKYWASHVRQYLRFYTHEW
ncbi:MAG: alpha/beta hydrolase-fold protein [Anaerolineae bacterium]|nr:alpha/beta hydrolase-fold protein [Anaerolineae bacterium]